MRFAPVNILAKNIARIDLNKATRNALEARRVDISELNREQLEQGIRADDRTLPPYSKASVEKFGKPPGAIKLFDKGDFYEGMKPTFTKTDFDIKNTDKKVSLLQYGNGEPWSAHPDGFGKEILGLTDDSIDKLAKDALGQIQFELRKQI